MPPTTTTAAAAAANMTPFARTTIVSFIFFMLLFANMLIFGVKCEEGKKKHHSRISNSEIEHIDVPFRLRLELMFIGSLIALLPYLFGPKAIRFASRYWTFYKNGGWFLSRALSNTLQARRLKVYSREEIEMATDNFNLERRIGEGGSQGTAFYRALLTDTSVAAVKKDLKVRNEHKLRFLEEATVLFNISHSNIVTLYGVCLQSEQPMLIYQSIESGEDLYDVIKNTRGKSWKQRLRVLKSIAHGVCHLHLVNISHKNLKLKNVIIKERKNVYLVDLDLANFQEQQHAEYKDVYDFGLIMAQVLNGNCDNDEAFVRIFMNSVKTTSEGRVFDPKLEPVRDKSELWKFALMACACLRQDEKERPSMEYVANVLSSSSIEIKSKFLNVLEHVSDDFTIPVESSPRSSGARSSTYRRSVSQISNEEAPIIRRDVV